MFRMLYQFSFFKVHYPCNPQQPGPAYFKTAKKCGLFGITDEGTNIQDFYVIDEGTVEKKGANSVISYLHHYLEHSEFDHGKTLVLHADNCWYVVVFSLFAPGARWW